MLPGCKAEPAAKQTYLGSSADCVAARPKVGSETALGGTLRATAMGVSGGSDSELVRRSQAITQFFPARPSFLRDVPP